MHRLALTAVCLTALAACQPEVPDSARGVGFESYSDYMRRRDAQLADGGQPMVSGPAISTESVSASPIGGTLPTTPLATTPLATASALPEGARPRGDAPAGIRTEGGEMARSGISDEQEFSAVASRETIESDAERLRRQREQYVVVQPTALPQRSGDVGPNIAQFATSTSHAPGTKMYSRSGIRFRSYEQACAPFSSADLAQIEFLRRGGPQRDPMGVDPDGDGFACGWDPRPFRAGLN
ncbi:hypothetical protein SAMN05421774_10469 [Gemmobacter megaterium]|uniref:Excalibur calcium-binding domain-containing protein n=1 Tax=Gemmobacter megaterium TaxID=1086013 RepID=A0A1N7NQV6_9RHOB|nr:hypothetical protein [Gemmobacter megaterium]GGE17172.1 hypothetical protein GCM10011345_23830 [Gemmobacter megaterium]SIT00691.1 hypothetical protein SAMN05421774_10469 [Gemmobacter megaterium]